MRDDLLRDMRHELHTPVNHIVGYSELLLEEVSDRGRPSLSADLEKIRSAGKELLTVVDAFLRPGKKGPGTTDTEAFAHRVRTLLNSVIGYSGLLQENVEDLGELDLIPDLQKIYTAGLNLLAHVDAALESIDAETQALAGEAAVLSVVTDAEPGDAMPSASGSSPASPSVGSGHLLVVDDDEINRDMLSRRLQRLGYRVALADSGHAALDLVQKQPFDLILLDVMMPGMDGYQVLGHLQADDTAREVPVIVLSALDETESAVRCIELGAVDYLPKPFDPVLLRARISTCLEKKRLRDQEMEYLRDVTKISLAAAAVEAKASLPENLTAVAERSDELGQLARVFQAMAHEVYAREERLRRQVQELRIEVDEVKRARQVSEITDTEYFQQLQRRARALRDRSVE